MKKIALVLAVPLLLAGCMTTRWECAVGNCVNKYQATNACLAQANTAFSRSKPLIWAQCMRGLGFQEYRCAENDTSGECRFLHVH